MSSSENHQEIERLAYMLRVYSDRLSTAFPELKSVLAIPNDTSVEEPQGWIASFCESLRHFQDLTYYNLIYGTFMGDIEYAVIPTSFVTGTLTAYLAGEVVRQARKFPTRVITSKTLIHGWVPITLNVHIIASGIMVLWNKQHLNKTGGFTAWNRYDLFFFTLAFNIIVTLIIKVYLHYHNKSVKRHYD